jgi:hypothetical protein
MSQMMLQMLGNLAFSISYFTDEQVLEECNYKDQEFYFFISDINCSRSWGSENVLKRQLGSRKIAVIGTVFGLT